MNKPNPYTRITLDVPCLGKITANYYTFNAIGLGLSAQVKENRSEGFNGLANYCQTAYEFIYDELTRRGFYED